MTDKPSWSPSTRIFSWPEGKVTLPPFLANVFSVLWEAMGDSRFVMREELFEKACVGFAPEQLYNLGHYVYHLRRRINNSGLLIEVQRKRKTTGYRLIPE